MQYEFPRDLIKMQILDSVGLGCCQTPKRSQTAGTSSCHLFYFVGRVFSGSLVSIIAEITYVTQMPFQLVYLAVKTEAGW